MALLSRTADIRTGLLYVKIIFASLIFGVVLLFLFLLLCSLVRNDADLAASNGLFLKLGRTGYLYSHASIQYVCGRHDRELSYLLRPGECRYADVEYDTTIRANSAGLRDDEDSLDNPHAVIIGDSHALGVGAHREESFATRVEEMSDLKVLNAGMSSYGTARELMLLRRLEVGNAEYVIIQYCRNDFDENKAYLNAGGRLEIMPEEKYETVARVDRERHRSFAQPGMGVATRAVEKVGELGASLVSGRTEKVDEVTAFKFALSRNKDLLQGKKVIILELNGHNRYDNMFIEKAKSRLGDLGLDLRFIDTSRFLTDEDYYVLDNHMRARGHKKVADAIVDVMRTW